MTELITYTSAITVFERIVSVVVVHRMAQGGQAQVCPRLSHQALVSQMQKEDLVPKEVLIVQSQQLYLHFILLLFSVTTFNG